MIKWEIQAVFQDLSSDELLSWCLEGTTQNPDETFNQFVWQRCPKQTFVSKQVLESGVYSSVSTYNDGFISLKNVFKSLTLNMVNTSWKEPIHETVCMLKTWIKKNWKVVKDRRKKLRAIRKGLINKYRENEEEGDAYSSGHF